MLHYKPGQSAFIFRESDEFLEVVNEPEFKSLFLKFEQLASQADEAGVIGDDLSEEKSDLNAEE